MTKSKNAVQTGAVTHNPFGSLAGKLWSLPSVPAPLKLPGEPIEKKASIAKATVRYERKGRGGKEATIVEVVLPAEELERWLSELKKLMGCGGVIEGGNLVVQGDQRTRVAEWLKKVKGVGKVSVG